MPDERDARPEHRNDSARSSGQTPAARPPALELEGRRIGPGEPVFVVAEMSANHNQDLAQALRIIDAAAEAGADAVKLQTYTADTMTLDSERPEFQVGPGTLWEGEALHALYARAHTPWEWHADLAKHARDRGLVLFSAPFDASAVEFLRGLEMPLYKIASFELVDIPLIRLVAATGKPVILSTGMATREEIAEALEAARAAGATQLALLRCTSAYPAPPESMNLRTIPALEREFGVVTGLSDHTLGIEVPIAAVGLGACIIEKHITLSRDVPGPDSAFSLEPQEFAAMVGAVRKVERSLGEVHFGVSEPERASVVFRRSLFVVAPVRRGERFSEANLRAIRPGHGLAPRHMDTILTRRAARDLETGTPLSWDDVADPE